MLKILLSGNELCENDNLLVMIFTNNFINSIQQILDLYIEMLILCLLCNRDDVLKLCDLFL